METTNNQNEVKENQLAVDADRRSIFLADTRNVVNTTLRTADEVNYAVDVELYKKNRNNYFALKEQSKPIDKETYDYLNATKRAVGGTIGSMVQSSERIIAGTYDSAVNRFNLVKDYANAYSEAGKENQRAWDLLQANKKSLQARVNLGRISEEQARVEYQKALNDFNFANPGDKLLAERKAEAEENFNAMQELGREALRIMKDNHENALKAAGYTQKDDDGLYYKLASGITSIGAAVGTTLVTGNPAAASILFGSTAGRDMYEEALENGVDPDVAWNVGVVGGTINAAVEYIGTDKFFDLLKVDLTKPLAKRLTKEVVAKTAEKQTSKEVAKTAEKQATKEVVKEAQKTFGKKVAEAGVRVIKSNNAEGVEELVQQISEETIMQNFGGRVKEFEDTVKDCFESYYLGVLSGVPHASLIEGTKLFLQRKKGLSEKEATLIANKVDEAANTPQALEKLSNTFYNITNPIQYNNGDPVAAAKEFAEAAAQAVAKKTDREVIREGYRVGDKISNDLQKAGKSKEEAEAVGAVANAATVGLYNLSGITPQDQVKLTEINVRDMSKNVPQKTEAEQLAEIQKKAKEAQDKEKAKLDAMPVIKNDFSMIDTAVKSIDPQVKGQKQLNYQLNKLNEISEKVEDKNVKEIANALTNIEQNLDNMDHSVSGVSQTRQAVNAKKEELKQKGYEIVDVKGKKFVEGSRILINNEVTDDSLPEGVKIIDRVLKPQINKEGKLLQSAEVIVRVGTGKNVTEKGTAISQNAQEMQPVEIVKQEPTTSEQVDDSFDFGANVKEEETLTPEEEIKLANYMALGQTAADAKANILAERQDKNVDVEQLFQMAGAKSQTANKDLLATAQDLYTAGKSNEEIRQQTGWFKGVDGKWRYEISDQDAQVIDIDINKIKQQAEKNIKKLNDNLKKEDKKEDKFLALYEDAILSGNTSQKEQANAELKKIHESINKIKEAIDNEKDALYNTSFKLSDILKHDKLFAAYPGLKNIKVSYEKLGGDVVGATNTTTGKITINTLKANDNAKIKKTILHEVQHLIQTKEGFARGGSTSEFRSKALPKRLKDVDLTRTFYSLELYNALKHADVKGLDKSLELPSAEYIKKFLPQLKELAKTNQALANTIKGWEDLNEQLKDYDKNTATNKYLRLAGEVEARNTETRANYTDLERAMISPESTQDVANADAIVVFDNGTQVAYSTQEITQDNTKYTIEKKAEYSNRTEIIPSRLKKTAKKFARQVDITEEAKSKLNTVIAPISISIREDIEHISNKDFEELLLSNIEKTDERRYVQLSDGNFALVSKGDAAKMTNTSVSFKETEYKNINKNIVLNIKNVTKNAILVKEHKDLGGKTEFSIKRYITPVYYNNSIYVTKITVKEFSKKRSSFSEKIYKLNGNKDFGQYNIEVVKKISSDVAAADKPIRPQQRTNDSIDNTNQFVKGFLLKEYLAGISDDTGTYYTEEKTTNRQGQSTKSFLQETVKQINKTNAQIVNENLKQAKQMLEDGATAEQVEEATDWTQDEKGWYFNVNDDEVSVNNLEEIAQTKTSGQLTLGDLISYPKLFAVYPFLRNLPVDFASGYNRFFIGIQLERKQLTDGTLKRDICRMLDSYTKNEGRVEELYRYRDPIGVQDLSYYKAIDIDYKALEDKGVKQKTIEEIRAINDMTPVKPKRNPFALYAWNKEVARIKNILNSKNPLKEFLATTTDENRVKMVLAAVNKKDLYATHNMSLQGLKQSLKLGGLAMPSLAVRRISNIDNKQFGDISFIGNEKLAKTSRSVEVYNQDAWTPSLYQNLRYKLSKETEDLVRNILKKTGEERRDSSYLYNLEERITDDPKYNSIAIQLYAKDKGLDVDKNRIGEDPAYIEWYNTNILDKAEAYLWVENDANTDMVKRKLTLPNMMKLLRKKDRSGGAWLGDRTVSLKEVLPYLTKQFSTLKDVKKQRSKLTSREEVQKIGDQLDKEFYALAKELRKEGKEKEWAGDTTALGRAIANVGNKERQIYHLKQAGLDYSEEALNKINKFIEKIQNELPVEYFEAKPRKIVHFSDFSGVIMPNTKEYDKVADELSREYNLPVYRIEKGNNQEYEAALNKIQNNVDSTTFFQGAWHGAAVDFDYFDFQFMGTGEGAQVHGWGGYVAKNREISDNRYRKRLSKEGTTTYDGKKPKGPLSFWIANYKLSNNKINEERLQSLIFYTEKCIKEQKDLLNFYKSLGDLTEEKFNEIVDKLKNFKIELEPVNYNAASYFFNAYDYNKFVEVEALKYEIKKIEIYLKEEEEALNDLKTFDPSKIKTKKGQLYEVDIPENNELLHENDRLRNQPKEVQDKLSSVYKDLVKKGKIKININVVVPIKGISPLQRLLLEDYARFLAGASDYNPKLEIEKSIQKKKETLQAQELFIKALKEDKPNEIDLIQDQENYVDNLKYAIREKEKELNFLNKISEKEALSWAKDNENFSNSLNGEEIYNIVADALGSQKAASEYLNDHGIKGIRYFGDVDGECFVVFDAKNIAILKKYYEELQSKYGHIDNPKNKAEELYNEFGGRINIAAIQEIINVAKEQGDNPGILGHFMSSILSAKESGTDGGKYYNLDKDKITRIWNVAKNENEKQEVAARGSVTINARTNEAIIALMKKSDPSTALHEIAHIWEQDIFRLAKMSNSQEIINLAQDLRNAYAKSINHIKKYIEETTLLSSSQKLDYMQTIDARGGEDYIRALALNEGIDTDDEVAQFIRRGFSEYFTTQFERYAEKGYAPNEGLKKVFEQFKKWLSAVYNAVKNRVELAPEMKEVFDKLLATKKVDLAAASKFKGKIDLIKQATKNLEKGSENLTQDVTIDDLENLLNIADAQRPEKPEQLLTLIRRTGVSYGPDWVDIPGVDREQLANLKIKRNDHGLGESNDMITTLNEWGYHVTTVDEASNLIQRAITEKRPIYPDEAQEALKQWEEYQYAIDTIRDAFGSVAEARKVLRQISDLREKGIRVVSASDLKFVARKIAELDKLAEQNRTGELGNADYTAANRVRNEVIKEIKARQLQGKEEIIKVYKSAKTAEEIREATSDVINLLESAYEKTEEAKDEKKYTDVPNTDYGKLKVQILKEVNDVLKATAEQVKQAQELDLAMQRKDRAGHQFTPEERAEWQAAKNKIDRFRLAPFRNAVSKALAGIRHLPAKDKGKFISSLRSFEMERMLPATIDNILKRAKEIEEKNYKNYMQGKIQEILDRKLFDKSSSGLKKAKLSSEAMDILRTLKQNSKVEPAQAELLLKDRITAQAGEGVGQVDRLINGMLKLQAYGTGEENSTQLFKQVYDDISEVYKAGKGEKNLEKMIMDFRLQKDRNDALEAIAKNKKAGLFKKAYLHFLGNWESFVDVVFSAELKEEYSLLSEEAESVKDSHQRRTEIMEKAKAIYGLKSNWEMQNKMQELIKDEYEFTNFSHVDTNPDPAAIKKAGKPFKEKLNKMQIITAYIYSMNDTLDSRLIRQYGKDQLAEMFNTILSKEDKLLGKLLQAEAEKSYGDINTIFIKERGFDLPKVHNYFPSKTERVESEIDLLKATAEMAKNPSFIKGRAESAQIQMRLENPFNILFAHIDRANEYVHKSQKVNRINRVFKSPTLKPFIIEAIGEDGHKRLMETIDSFSVRRPTQKYEMDKIGDWLTNNFVRGAIAAKPLIAIKQLTSAINYAENMPATTWTAGLIKAVLHPVETVKFMASGDPYLKARYESGSMNEAIARATSDAKALSTGSKFQQFANLLSVLTRLGDMGAIMFGGRPYVEYLMSRGMTKEEAFNEFRKSTLRSQQASSASSLSVIQNNKNDNFLMRALYAFKNTPAQYARKIVDAYAEMQRGEITKAQFAKVVAIYGILNSWFYSALTTLGILRWATGDDDDDETTKEILINEFLFSPFTSMFNSLPILDLVGENIASQASSLIVKGKPTKLSSKNLPIVDDLVKLGNHALKEEVGAEDILKMIIESGQIFGGLPTKYAAGVIQGTANAKEEPFQAFLQALGYTQHRAQIATNKENK